MTKHDMTYLPAIWTAGYSGYVVYSVYIGINGEEAIPSYSSWMIPGTYEYDWDNRQGYSDDALRRIQGRQV